MPRQKQRCTIDGCDGWCVGRGLCRKHYTRWHVWGDPLALHTHVRGVCEIEGCGQPQKAHGWCQTHYRRWQRHGDPLAVERVRNTGTIEDRFWARVDTHGPIPPHRPELGRCWIWQGTDDGHGYGQFSVAGRLVHAYRWGYERFIGPVCDGMELDHLCRNRTCVRFDHLEPVTHRENTLRGESPSARHARATHCPQGHPYDEENTVYEKCGSRRCRICLLEKQRRQREKRRAARS